jgi:hypothetical protein
MKSLPRVLLALLLPALAAPIGCATEASDAGGACESGKCDELDRPDSEIPATPCDGILHDLSGRNHSKVAGRLNDPLANFVFKTGTDCPATFGEIMDKLRTTDTGNCADAKSGISTRFISETAQATGQPTSYRAVVTRTCGERSTHELMFSLFGIEAGATQLPQNVEIIAFDKTAGVFNYYEAEANGEIKFFGNSTDMLRGANREERRCATCHTGGGPVMKELDTPWLHWEGHMDTPGAADLIANNEDLGQHTNGAEFEDVVKNANKAWNKGRIAFLKAQGTSKEAISALLRPLFCTVEVNLDNGADFASPIQGGPGGSEMSGIPFDSLLDPFFKEFGSIPVTFEDYDALIKQNGQTVEDVPGAIDTVFDYVYVERAFADTDYVRQLIDAQVLDDDLIKDVLAVDFTRPVFSTDRCDLLQFAPELAGGTALSPAAIRDGLIANLVAADVPPDSPAGHLVRNLKRQGDEAVHHATVDKFVAACQALGSRALLERALTITSLNRDLARGMKVFEFPPTMPDDNLNVTEGLRLHPDTCDLVEGFIFPLSEI